MSDFALFLLQVRVSVPRASKMTADGSGTLVIATLSTIIAVREAEIGLGGN